MSAATIARRALKAAGRTVLTQAEWRKIAYRPGDVLLTAPGSASVFMNAGHHTPMFEHGDRARYQRDVLDDATQACSILVEAGLTVRTKLDWFLGTDGRMHASRSEGGFYVEMGQ